MNPNQLADEAARLADQAHELSNHAQTLMLVCQHRGAGGQSVHLPAGDFPDGLLRRLLCGLERHPALHSPLMAVTNAISSVIIVGAMLATGLATSGWAMVFGFIAVTLASVNIFGGFLVTHRMLSMFKKKQ